MHLLAEMVGHITAPKRVVKNQDGEIVGLRRIEALDATDACLS